MKPAEFIGGRVGYDREGTLIWGISRGKGKTLQRIVDLRGWGAIQQLFKDAKGNIDTNKAATFQDELGEWIAEAINEKLERKKK